MYGISNSQQQGGGGGGAASYKAIKSIITPSDWQEVAGATPYFVGDDATTWAIDSQTNLPAKISSDNIGTTEGQQYTITIEASGVEYSSTATATDIGGMLTLQFQFPEAAAAFILMYDYFDWATKTPGTGSFVSVQYGQNTSLVITNFAGEGFGTTIQATIADSAIKVNSAVTMYTNTSYKIAAGEKTNGSIALTAPSVPNAIISYNLEIVGTDTEGLFEIVNGYVPEIPDTPSGVPQWHTVYEDTTGTGVTSIDNLPEPLKGGELYRITIEGDFYIFCLHHDGDNVVREENIVVEQLNAGNNSLTHNTMSLVYHERSLSLAYELYYHITDAGISNYDFSTVPGIKFTKLEVYR